MGHLGPSQRHMSPVACGLGSKGSRHYLRVGYRLVHCSGCSHGLRGVQRHIFVRRCHWCTTGLLPLLLLYQRRLVVLFLVVLVARRWVFLHLLGRAVLLVKRIVLRHLQCFLLCIELCSYSTFYRSRCFLTGFD